MNINYFFSLFFLIAYCPLAVAQKAENDKPALPTGPILKRVPDYSQWIVTSLFKEDENKPKAISSSPILTTAVTIPKQNSITKTGSTICEQIVSKEGQSIVIWHDAGLRLYIPKGMESNPTVSLASTNDDFYTINFGSSDFAGLNWISKDNYTGVQKYKGRDCYVFQTELSLIDREARERLEAGRARLQALADAHIATTEAMNPEKKSPVSAYIDMETQLPLAATFGSEVRTYTYGQPPSAKLTLPPALAKEKQRYLARLKRFDGR